MSNTNKKNRLKNNPKNDFKKLKNNPKNDFKKLKNNPKNDLINNNTNNKNDDSIKNDLINYNTNNKNESTNIINKDISINPNNGNNGKSEDLPYVTILIPALDEASVIGNTIEQILQVDYPQDRFEILVATYKNDIKTREIVNQFTNKKNVKEAVNQNKPPTTKAQNINNAYRSIDGRTKFIGVHDAEDGTSSNILKNIVMRCNNNNNGQNHKNINDKNNYNGNNHMVQTKVIVDIDNDSTLSEIASAVNFSRYYNIVVPGKECLGFLIFSAGTGTYFDKDFIDKCIALDGFFLDEKNLVEDFEFSMRMAMHNYKITYEPDSYVHEKFPRTFKSAVRQRSRWSLGSIQTLLKHGLPKEFSIKEKIGLIIDYLGLSSPIWIVAFLISIICIVAPFVGFKFIQVDSVTWYISIINTAVSTEKIVATPYFVLKDTKDANKIRFKYARIILAIFLNDLINCVAVSKAMYNYVIKRNLEWDKTQH